MAAKRQLFLLRLKQDLLRRLERPACIRVQQIVQATDEKEAREVAAKGCGEEGPQVWINGDVECDALKAAGRKSKVLVSDTRILQ